MSERKLGPQLIEFNDLGDEALVEATKKAMSTPLVKACHAALGVIAELQGLEGCEGGDSSEPCQFPMCLALGCEGEPVEPAPGSETLRPALPETPQTGICDFCGETVPFSTLEEIRQRGMAGVVACSKCRAPAALPEGSVKR